MTSESPILKTIHVSGIENADNKGVVTITSEEGSTSVLYENGHKPVVTFKVRDNDLLGTAQLFFEAYLASCGIEAGSKRYASRLKAWRKAAGYSYP